jgi:ABC-2 type transport system permease protein
MIVANNLKSLFAYRFHVIFQIVASAFSIVIQFFLWRSVFAANPDGVIRGMTFQQTFLYVSLATAITVLMRTWADWEMCSQIRSGDIIMFFFKPIDYMRYAFANSMGSMAGNFITVTIPSLLIIFVAFQSRMAFGWNVPFFAATLIGSCVLSFLFDFLVGTTCFWTLSIWGISVAKDFAILFFSGALVPLRFFPDSFARIIGFMPFPYMYNLPLTILTSNQADLGAWGRGIACQFAWIAVGYCLCRMYFSFSLKKLTVNGG